MSFPGRSRVVLLKPYLGIPAFTLGTVDSSGPVTSNVDFDGHPDTVMVPNSLLRLAGERLAQARYKGGEAVHKVTWYPPRILKPGTSNESTFVPVTATPNLLSLLFQGAEVALRGAVTSGYWIGALEFPITGGPVNLNVDVRDFVDQPDGARSSITVVIDDVPNTIRFQGKQSVDGTQTFNAAISGAPTQTITVIILCERPAGADDLLVVLDSLEISVV